MLKKISGLLLSGVLSAAVPAFAQDVTPPTLAVTAPANYAYVNSLPAITGTSLDDVFVSSVMVSVRRQSDSYYWNGAAFTAVQSWLNATVLSTGAASSWSYATVPAWLNGATYEINARAMDSSGNWSVSYSTAVFNYDTGNPVSVVTVPAQNASIPTFSAINGTAADAESFIGQVWVKIARATDSNYWNESLSQWTAAEAWNLAAGSATWTYTGLTEAALTSGTTYFAVSRASDLAGNVQPLDVLGSTFVYTGAVVSSTVAYWDLNEGAGLAAADSTGNGHDGSLVNGAAWGQGVSSSAISLDGLNDYVNVPDSSFLTPQAGLTVSFWANRETGGAVVEYLVTKDALADRSWQVYLTSADIQWRVYDSTGTEAALVVTDGLSTYGEWAHLAVVFDPAGWLRVYRDGAEIASSTHAISGLNDNSAPLRLGAGYWTPQGYDYYFKGKLDEVGVYPRVLAPSEISALYSLHYSTPPALSSAAFSGVGISSLTVNWGSTFDPGTNYFVRLATQPASSPYVAMATTTATSHAFTGLTPDTTYYGFVSTDTASGYLASGSGLTYASPPMISTAAYWSFDEGAGLAAADSSGNGNDGSLINGAAWGQGVSSSALSLDGLNDYVNVPDASILTPQDGLTVSFWAYRETGGAVVEYLVTKDALADRSWQIYLTTSAVEYRVYGSTGTEGVLAVPDGFSVYGEWTHLAFVFDPSGWQRMYRNGAEIASSTHAISGLNDNSAPLRLGAGYWTPQGYAYYFKGKLDEVGVYPRVLTPSEINALYALHYSTPPALSSAAFSGAGTDSLTMNWGSTYDPGTNYFVRLATQPASSPYVAMATTTALAYGFNGLTPDTTYYGFVSTDTASGYLASGSGLTYAAAPSSAAFTALAYSSAALTWSGGTNPAWTVYEYQVHTSTDFASFTSSGSLAAASAWFGGLSQGTTYFARVRAVGVDGTPTAYTLAGPAVTGRLYPGGVPAAVAGSALDISTISWTWSAGTLSSADIFIARENGATVSTQPFAASGSFIQTGLSPNTSHTLSVTGYNANGESAAAVSTAVYTLAAQPSGLGAVYVGASSAALSWGLNGNPAGTIAQLWRSLDDAAYSNVYEGAALSRLDAGLADCTVYYYKARARNGAGVYTAFTAPVSFTTAASTPAAPGGLYAEALDGARIALSWEHSPSTSTVTQYLLYYDNASGTIDYGTPYTAFSSTVTAWTTPALTPGNTYKFAIRARSRCGVEEANASAAYAQAVGVLSGVRAAIKAPQTGKRIKGNSVAVIAELALGTPSQVKKVRFQYRLAGNTVWTDVAAANINHPNPDTAAPYFVHWDADSMAAGTYELRALATDIYDAADPAPPVITVVIDPVDFDISESVTAGQVQKEQKINSAVTSTVQAADSSAALVSKVVIPAGAVNVTTVSVTLVPNPPSKPLPPAGSDDLSIAVKVNLSNGQTQLAGSAVVTLNYRDDDGDGVVDGTTADVGRLRIYSAPDSGGTWVPIATTIDRIQKTLTAPTTHFSFFSAFATTASGLSSLKAYPNPWQPGAGGRFDAAGVTFSGLPNEASIRIFTILGELVHQLNVTAADAGVKVWDGRNSEGNKAASGVYLVHIKSGGDDRVLKVGVER